MRRRRGILQARAKRALSPARHRLSVVGATNNHQFGRPTGPIGSQPGRQLNSGRNLGRKTGQNATQMSH